MKQAVQALKPVVSLRILSELAKAEKEIPVASRKGYLPFPNLFEKVCSSLRINKENCWKELRYLQSMNLIKIVPYRGVKLNYTEEWKYE